MLEAIGAKKQGNKTKADSPGTNYQDSVSVPISEEADNDAATQEGGDEDNEDDLAYEDLEVSAETEFILPAVDKESASFARYPF